MRSSIITFIALFATAFAVPADMSEKEIANPIVERAAEAKCCNYNKCVVCPAPYEVAGYRALNKPYIDNPGH